jgi:hypothetical protein
MTPQAAHIYSALSPFRLYQNVDQIRGLSEEQLEDLNWLWEHAPYFRGVNVYDLPGLPVNGCGPQDWPGHWIFKAILDLINRAPGLPSIYVPGCAHDVLYGLGGDETLREWDDDELARLIRARQPWGWSFKGLVRWHAMRAVAKAAHEVAREWGHRRFNYH